MIERIVCAVDGSSHSDKAVAFACDLASRYEAELHFIHVFMKGMTLSELEKFAEHAHLKDIVEQESTRIADAIVVVADAYPGAYVPPPSQKVITRIAEVVLEDARLAAEAKGIGAPKLATADGAAAEQILHYASQCDADMIVLGTRGLGMLAGMFLGSTSQKVVHLAECTTVAVK